mgnify:CR=1 FL=1
MVLPHGSRRALPIKTGQAAAHPLDNPGEVQPLARAFLCPNPGPLGPRLKKESYLIQLKPVTLQNFSALISLDVKSRQSHYVASNVESIAHAIEADGEPVGFVMYCLDHDDGAYWLYRLMIDQHHQGRGYGRQAMGLVLAEIRRRQPTGKVYLGVEPENQEAGALYQSLGFVPDGRVEGGETILELSY